MNEWQEKQKALIAKAPTEVREVIKALHKNATQRLLDDADDDSFVAEDLVCAGFDEESNEWYVGSNFEDGSSTMIFKQDNKWYYRRPYAENDRLAPNGYKEMLSNASIFFTG